MNRSIKNPLVLLTAAASCACQSVLAGLPQANNPFDAQGKLKPGWNGERVSAILDELPEETKAGFTKAIEAIVRTDAALAAERASYAAEGKPAPTPRSTSAALFQGSVPASRSGANHFSVYVK